MEKINISSSFGTKGHENSSEMPKLQGDFNGTIVDLDKVINIDSFSSSNVRSVTVDDQIQKMIRNNSMPGAFLPSRNYSEEIRHHAKEIVRKLEILLSDPNLTDPGKRKKYETLLIKQKTIVNDSSVNDLFDVRTLPKTVYVMEPDPRILEFFNKWCEAVWKDEDVRKKFERTEKTKADFKEKSYYNRNKNGKQKPSPFLVNLVGKVNAK